MTSHEQNHRLSEITAAKQDVKTTPRWSREWRHEGHGVLQRESTEYKSTRRNMIGDAAPLPNCASDRLLSLRHLNVVSIITLYLTFHFIAPFYIAVYL